LRLKNCLPRDMGFIAVPFKVLVFALPLIVTIQSTNSPSNLLEPWMNGTLAGILALGTNKNAALEDGGTLLLVAGAGIAQTRTEYLLQTIV